MSIVVNEEQFEDSIEEDIQEDNYDEVTDESVSDDLEAQIVDDLPEKFRGKSAADIAKSYAEVEKELGRKNNEVGELRKLTDDFLKQQLEVPTEKHSTEVDLDALLDNPSGVMNQAIENNPTIARLQQQMREAVIAEQRKGFEGKHTDWNDVLSSSDFRDWVTSSPVRQQMFTSANQNYDYSVLDEVFGLYKDVRGVAKTKAETIAKGKRSKALNNLSVEKGSTGEVSKKVFRRADLIRLKQTDPQRYSDMSDEIMLAYQEKRVK